MFTRFDKEKPAEVKPEVDGGARQKAARAGAQGYEAQRAELQPRAASVVQRRGLGDAPDRSGQLAGSTPLQSPGTAPLATSTVPQAAPAPVVGGAEAGSAADTRLTDELHRLAYDWLRKQAYAVPWMAALQRALGVAPTGVADVATVDAILAKHPVTLLNDPKAKTQSAKEKQAYRNQSTVTREMTAALKELSAGITTPDLPAHASATGLGKAGGAHGAGGNTPEDVAFQAQGGYGAYVSKQLKSGRFLGKPILAHPDMHDRLANATAYLKSKFRDATTDAALAAAVGVHTVVSFRPTTPTFDQMYHGLGFAIDLNPAQNNWHMGKGDNTWQLNRILGRVNLLFGTAEVRSALGMSANSKVMSTEGAYDAIARSNDQLKRYRVLANDRAQLEAHLSSPECPEAAKKLGLAHWAKVLAEDERTMSHPEAKKGGLMGPNGKPDHESGFMDLKLEMVQAMRDAGGLRWAGTDGGGDSGDLMHFDGGFIPKAAGMRGDVDRARRELAKAKAPVATDKEKVGG